MNPQTPREAGWLKAAVAEAFATKSIATSLTPGARVCVTSNLVALAYDPTNPDGARAIDNDIRTACSGVAAKQLAAIVNSTTLQTLTFASATRVFGAIVRISGSSQAFVQGPKQCTVTFAGGEAVTFFVVPPPGVSFCEVLVLSCSSQAGAGRVTPSTNLTIAVDTDAAGNVGTQVAGEITSIETANLRDYGI